MEKEKKCKCINLKRPFPKGSIYLGTARNKLRGKDMDALETNCDITINHSEDDSFEMYASFSMNGCEFYSKSISIKYCPFCGRKL